MTIVRNAVDSDFFVVYERDGPSGYPFRSVQLVKGLKSVGLYMVEQAQLLSRLELAKEMKARVDGDGESKRCINAVIDMFELATSIRFDFAPLSAVVLTDE